MGNLKIGIIGLGRIGKIHFKDIKHHFSDVEIYAASDIQLDNNSFKEQYGQVKFFQNPEDLISLPDIEAVLICSPTNTHATLVEKAIQHGKHIFCEKPLDFSLSRTKRLAEMAGTKGVKLMPGFNRRFDPEFMAAHQRIKAGEVGDIHVLKITSRDPGLPSLEYLKNSGGMLMDMTIHDFDMARYLKGKNVVEVLTRGNVFFDKNVGTIGDIDTALTMLTFEDGSNAIIDNSRVANYGYDQRAEIFGNKGMIQVKNILHDRNIIYNEKGISHSLPLDFFMDRYAKSYLNEIELFFNSVKNDDPAPVNGDDAFQATLIAVAAKKSFETKKIVRLSEIDID